MKIRNLIYLLIINSFLASNLSAIDSDQRILNKNLKLVNNMDEKTKQEFIQILSQDISLFISKKNKNNNKTTLHQKKIQKYKNKYNLTNHINTEILFNILYILTEENYKKEKDERESYEKRIAEQEEKEENEAANLIINLSKRKRETKEKEIELPTPKKQKLDILETDIDDIETENEDDDLIQIIEDKEEIKNIKIKAKEKQIESIITTINSLIKDEDKKNIIKIISELTQLNSTIELEQKKQIIIFFENPSKIQKIREEKINKGFGFVIPAPQSSIQRILETKLKFEWDETKLYEFAIQNQTIFKKLLKK